MDAFQARNHVREGEDPKTKLRGGGGGIGGNLGNFPRIELVHEFIERVADSLQCENRNY